MSERVVAIVAARMGSTRFPGKILRDLCGKAVLGWTVTAALEAVGESGHVWVATTTKSRDDAVVKWANTVPWLAYYRGSETDVLSRFVETARIAHADVVVRLTGDCPLLDPRVIAETIALRRATGAAYASNVHPPSWPDGLDCEVFTRNALEQAHKEATRPSDRETVTQYIYRNPDIFPAVNLTCPIPGLAGERWVLDTEEDMEFIRRVLEESGAPVIPGPSYIEILHVLHRKPELRAINSMWSRNERFFAEVAKEIP